MVISDLVEQLQRHQQMYGDLDVIAKDEVGAEKSFNYEDLYVDTDHADGSITLLIDA